VSDAEEPTYLQSAVIPWRRRDDDGSIEVALITSFSGKRWVIPKGLIDPGETPHESAAREAEEEAGLFGTVNPNPIGQYRYHKWGGTCIVAVFLMHVTRAADTWLEQDTRTREWVSIEEAAMRIREDDLAQMVREIEQHIAAQNEV